MASLPLSTRSGSLLIWRLSNTTVPFARVRVRSATALRFGRARAALSLWSMGINQSHVGTDKNSAIINLHLATGQIGRPGSGPLSLTGQPNAMGGRETGGLAHLLPGYRLVADAGARAVVERHWAVPAGRLPSTPGRAALEIFDGEGEDAIDRPA